MPTIGTEDLAALRDQFQWSKFYLGVLKPATVHTSQINYPAMPRGTLAIPFDTGAYAAGFTVANITAGMTLWVGTTAGSHDICKLRIRTPYSRTCTAGSAFTTADVGVSGTITVCEHNYLLLDNYYLTIKEEYRLWPKHAIAVQGGIDVLRYNDYDIQYCGQNKDANRDPIVRMGPPGVAIRDATTGDATINFWSDSGAAPGGNAPAAYAWKWRDGTPATAATAGTAAAPHAVTWTEAGNYLATLTLDGDVTGYRPVFIFDPTGSNTPYEDFEVSSLGGDFSTGGWRMSVRVKEDCAEADFPEESMVMLFAEDWYKGDQVSIGGNYAHRENVIFCGYITSESVRKDPYTNDVLFETHTIDGEMKNCEQFPLSVEDDPTAGANWLQIEDMTIDKVAYFIAKWQSTLLDITDVHFSGDTKLVRWFDMAQKSLYEQIDKDCYNSALMGRCLSDRMGLLQCEINPQFLDVGANRNSIDTILDIQEQDWRDEIQLPRPQTDRCSLVDVSAGSYAGGLADVELVFSLAHGDVPMERGRTAQLDNLIGSNQNQLNSVAGNYLANQNNPYPNISVPIGLNYRVFDIAPQEWVTMSFAASDTERGITWTDRRLIPRTISFSLENAIGALNVNLGLEMETSGTAGVAGYYPTEPPEETYTPPTTPVDPPWIPPTEGDGKTVYVATDKGIARCDDVTAGAAATWTAINTGLGVDLAVLAFRFDPSWVTGNKRGTCNTRTAVYTGAHLDGVGGTPTWTQKLTVAQARTACGAAAIDGFVGPRTAVEGGKLAGFIIGPTMFEANYIGVFAYDDNSAQNVQHWYLHSHDWGATWSCAALDTAWARMIVPKYSLHINNKIHVVHFYKAGHGDDAGAYEYSNDGGHTWSITNGVAGIGFPGDIYLRDWLIPYKKNTGAINADEKENWVAHFDGAASTQSATRSTTAITSGHAAVGPSVLQGYRISYSTHNPLDWVLMTSNKGGDTCKIYYTTNWAVSWTLGWSADDTYYPTCLAGFPYSGDYFYWGAYRAGADPTPVYLWYTRDTFATTTAFRGDLDTVLGLAAGDKVYTLVPDWTAT